MSLRGIIEATKTSLKNKGFGQVPKIYGKNINLSLFSLEGNIRAFLVGLNDYHKIKDLKGSQNSIEGFRELLANNIGVNKNDIFILTDSKAKLNNIKTQLEWYKQNLKKNDIFIFYFVGHSSQTRDKTGIFPNGLVNLLCPFDTAWDGTYLLVTDLIEMVGNFKSNQNIVIID